MSEALFKYSLKASRGRYLRLRVSLRGEVEVVVPRGFDTAKVPAFLKQKERWIRDALEQARVNNELFEPAVAWKLPRHIELAALGRVWRVSAKETGAARVTVREQRDCLMVSGPVNDEQACRAALGRWLMRRAWEHLPPRLHALSLTTGLGYQRAVVRRQRTRWGSCSRRRSISLNAKLLFLAPELHDYVMVHELCHTVEMNPSQRFWEVVKRHSPDHGALDKRLRDGWKAVPRWAS